MTTGQCPMHVSESQIREFDHQRDPIAEGKDPLDWYVSEFRDQPAFWSTKYGGFWVLTDPAQIREASSTPALFSSRNVGLGYPPFPAKQIPIQTDPPDHAKYRRLLAPYFSPRAADALEPQIRAKAVELVEAVQDKGECEFISEVAGKLPQHIFVEHILHLPPEHVEMFLGWEHDLMHHPRDPEVATQAGKEVYAYLIKTIEERIEHPLEGDMLSELTRAEIDGKRISPEELLGMLMLLFLAGLDTVTTELTWTVRYLSERPDHRAQLVNQPEIIPAAVEEFLRYTSFAQAVRTVVEDMDFHGVRMAAGDRVLIPPVLVGRNSQEFENPDELDFDRPNKMHMAFGLGVHRCLGSHLARKELQIALHEWHQRIPDYAMSGEPLSYHAGGVQGINALQLRWPVKAATS